MLNEQVRGKANVITREPEKEKEKEIEKTRELMTHTARGVAQLVECLPSMCKALDFIPSTADKTKQNNTIKIHT
jgi:hypothetical protein